MDATCPNNECDRHVNELNEEPKGKEMFLPGGLYMNTSCTVETSKLTLLLQKVRNSSQIFIMLRYVVL